MEDVFLVEEVRGRYEGCGYKVLECFLNISDALKEASTLQYRKKCEDDLLKDLRGPSYQPSETYYPVYSVIKGEETGEEEDNPVAPDKKRVNAELSELRQQVVDMQTRRAGALKREKEKKHRRDIEDLQCFVSHFQPGIPIPEHIRNIGPSAALCSKDPALYEWVLSHVLT